MNNLLKIVRMLLLCAFTLFQYNLYAQLIEPNGSVQITYPIANSVFQQNSSGNAVVTFTGQSLKGTYYDAADLGALKLKIYKYSYGTTPHNGIWEEHRTIPVTFDPCNGCIANPEYDPYTFYINSPTSTQFEKGWYQVALGYDYTYCGTTVFIKATPWKKFGVGDVYMVAGQSNASGFTRLYDNELMYFESITPFSGSGNGTPKIVDSQVWEGSIINKIFTNNRDINSEIDRDVKGLPYFTSQPVSSSRPQGFTKFVSGLEGANNEMGIAPAGLDSWSWQRFSNDLVAAKKYPVLTYNIAKPNSSVREWNTSRFDARLKKALQMYGGASGLKAILWQQGEYETDQMMQSSTPDITYVSDLNSLIAKSRNNGLGGHSIPWVVSKTSLITRVGTPPFNADKVDVLSITANSGANFRIKGKTGGQSNTITWQGNVLTVSNKIYEGPSTDAFDYNTRSTFSRLHLDGYQSDVTGKSGLQQSAEKWIEKVSNVAINNPISPLVLNKMKLTKSSSNYNLTILDSNGNQINSGFFFWVKNEGGIQDAIWTGNNVNIPQNSQESDYYITCYYQANANSPLVPSQPYFVKQNSSGARIGGGTTSSSRNITSVPAAGASYTEPITNFKDGSFPIPDNCLGWAFLTYDANSDNYVVNVQPNTSSSARSGTITISNSNNTTYTKTITISQVASGTSSDYSLTNFTPTSASAGWGSPNYNGLNVGGNDIYISGIKYTQGIGTHAQSHITYNIPSGYQYFKGKVGRDDAADGCNCGDMLTSFTIKLNGATVWNSGQHGISTPAEDFNVNINGSGGILELINNAGVNNWGDWADWVNIYLSNTIGNNSIPEPTYYYSNPTSISSGQSSTLNATCSTGLVTWSTGQTGSGVSVSPSVTTSYTVRCVSGSQQSDPRTVSVTVSGGGTCSVLSNNLVMGTWNITGDQLVTRNFHNDFWLVQKVNVNGSQYDEFVVRAGEMLQRSDVSLNNSSYSGLVNCYALEYSAYGGLLGPNHTSTVPFATPVGYTLYYTQDGTPYYSNYNTSSGAITNNGCYRIKSLANNYYLTAIGGDYNEFQSGNSGNNKIWKFSTTDNTNWKIKSGSGDNKFLYGEGTYCGARVKRTSNGSQTNQLWRYDQNGNNFRFFLPNGTTWDHEGAGTLNNLQMCGDNTQGFQNWRLVSLEGVSCPSGVRVGNAEAGRIEEVELSLLTIAPNPTDGLIHVSLNASQAGPAVLNLLDITGKKYLEHSLKAKMGLNEFDIDATWASPGTYLLQATVGDKNGSVRVVIE